MNVQSYTQIINRELVAALGCTEPISIAYGAALLSQLLNEVPEKITVSCSGNIIKNVKGVIVPESDGMRGVEIAALLGACGGNADKGLQVLQGINKIDKKTALKLLKQNICTVKLLNTEHKLHLIIEGQYGDKKALVEILGGHTCVVRKEINGETVFKCYPETESKSCCEEMNIAHIIEYADTVPLKDINETIVRQITYNTAIAKEGMKNSYGVSVGKTLLEAFGNDVATRARAFAAAGSDARMSGCTMPVVINSGSGNQGITASLPVIEYAKHLNVPQEKLIRALLVSNLCAIHQKNKIGRLSAYCGAVSAACGAGAGIAYLHNVSLTIIQNTITNTLANVSGIVCDGAKPSCAAKIASSIDAAILAFQMAKNGRTFCSGEGIVKNDIEKTICGIGRLASEGMQATDTEILNIMLDC